MLVAEEYFDEEHNDKYGDSSICMSIVTKCFNQSKVTIKGTRGSLTEVRVIENEQKEIVFIQNHHNNEQPAGDERLHNHGLKMKTLFHFQTIQYITKNKVMETESRELAAVSRGFI